jgi:hypothetical protein
VQYGLVPRLFKIVQQLVALSAKRQQQGPLPPFKSFSDTANEAERSAASARISSAPLASTSIAAAGGQGCSGLCRHAGSAPAALHALAPLPACLRLVGVGRLHAAGAPSAQAPPTATVRSAATASTRQATPTRSRG